MNDIYEITFSYYKSIANGEVLSNTIMKDVANRFLSDIRRSSSDDFPYVFDPSVEAEDVIKLSKHCRQTQDKWAGKAIELQPWQIAWICNLYGWRKKQDRSQRRFTEAFLQVSRKAGKTALLGMILLHDLITTNQAQGLCVAVTRDQAHMLWDAILGYVSGDEIFRQIEVKKATNKIVYPLKWGYIKTMATQGQQENFNGLSPSCAVMDEIGSFPDKRVYNTIKSGQGARQNPLLITIGSATSLLQGAGKNLRDYSEKMLKGLEPMDETFFPTVYCLDDNDDWKDEKLYAKAQPNLNYTVGLDFYIKLRNKAFTDMVEEEEFKTKLLGLYVRSVKTFIPYSEWQKCMENSSKFSIDADKPYHAVGAIDLSTRDDLTAFSIAIYQDGRYYMKHHFYFPSSQLSKKIKRDSEYWGAWMDRGLVTKAGTNVIDYSFLMHDVMEEANRWNITEILIDPHNMNAIGEEAFGDITLVPVSQQMKWLSPMTKDWQSEILSHNIVDDNPVMAYMVSNAEVYTDANMDIKIQKMDRASGEYKRIDGCITSLMSVARIKQLLQAGEIDLRTEEEVSSDFKKLMEIEIPW